MFSLRDLRKPYIFMSNRRMQPRDLYVRLAIALLLDIAD